MASTPDTVHKLLLHPIDTQAVPTAAERMLEALTACGLIGLAFDFGGGLHYFPGDRFLELIMFLGCSPAVALEPPPDSAGAIDAALFCNVRIDGPLPQMRFRPGVVETAPRCPVCRASVNDWLELIRDWQASGADQWTCPDCTAGMGLHELNWRHNAGFGRMFVEVWGIHPHEAVPADRLLACLQEATGQPWTYCYTAS